MTPKQVEGTNSQDPSPQTVTKANDTMTSDSMTSDSIESAALSRRGFVQGSSAVALTLAFSTPSSAKLPVVAAEATNGRFEPNAWISIAADGKVKLMVHRSEMGQGVRVALPMMLADELCVDIETVEIEQGVADTKYGNQNTDGSTSIRLNWEPLRNAGAAAREMLTQAAANKMGVPANECQVTSGVVEHRRSGKTVPYADVVADAAALEVPTEPKTLDRAAYRYIGKPMPNWDVPDIVVGKADFGIDMRLPGMVFASIERSPTVAGKVKSFDATAAKAVRGVKSVHQLEPNTAFYKMFGGVAVVASSTWAAMKGRKALEIEWDRGGASENSDTQRQMLDTLVDGEGKAFRSEGDFAAAKAGAAKVMSAKYHAPHLAHAPMEPLAATVLVKSDSAEVWAPTQDPKTAKDRVAQLLGLEPEKVTVNVTLLGGGFGRKSKPDFIFEAALLAKEMPGTPVKLTWTREDEIRHGYYRSQNAQKIEATLDSANKVTGWRHHTAFTSLVSTFAPTMNEPSGAEVDMGMTNMPYRFPAVQLEKSAIKSDLRIGWLRSVCNTFHAHAINCFVDELAEAAKMDPVAYRLEMLGESRVVEFGSRDKPGGQDIGRLRNVIEKCAEMSNWGKAKLPSGVGHGFASHFSFLTYVAMAMQASVSDGKARVHHVDCVMDCGTFVNPDTVRAQIEGAVVFGLSYALYGSITAKDGAVVESNFHNYPVLRIDEMPTVNIHLVENTKPPAGVGEPGVPPVAPALSNALYASTGKRYRDLPLAGQLA